MNKHSKGALGHFSIDEMTQIWSLSLLFCQVVVK
jgi:hypothetical protein